MILQALAHEFPERLRSAVIVASSSGSPDLPPLSPETEAFLMSEPDAAGREAHIAHTLKLDRIWGSPGCPLNEAERRCLIERAHDRCHCPNGIGRQYAAIIACRTCFADLERIAAPTPVIRGTDDTLVPLTNGQGHCGAHSGRFLAWAMTWKVESAKSSYSMSRGART